MILARIYASFGENHGKLRTAGRQARPGFEPGTSRLPVLSVTAKTLVGLEYILKIGSTICEICSKRFSHNDHLKQLCSLHTEEKPLISGK